MHTRTGSWIFAIILLILGIVMMQSTRGFILQVIAWVLALWGVIWLCKLFSESQEDDYGEIEYEM